MMAAGGGRALALPVEPADLAAAMRALVARARPFD